MAEMRNTGIDTLPRFAIGAGAGGFRTAGPSMATPEYYRKQIELLLDWADTVTNAELQISLIQRALTFYHSQIGLMIKRSSVFKKGCITLQCPATR